MNKKAVWFFIFLLWPAIQGFAMQPLTDGDLDSITAGRSDVGHEAVANMEAAGSSLWSLGNFAGDKSFGSFSAPPVGQDQFARGGGISIFIDDVKMYLHFDALWYTDTDGLRGSDGASIGITNYSSMVQINAITAGR